MMNRILAYTQEAVEASCGGKGSAALSQERRIARGKDSSAGLEKNAEKGAT